MQAESGTRFLDSGFRCRVGSWILCVFLARHGCDMARIGLDVWRRVQRLKGTELTHWGSFRIGLLSGLVISMVVVAVANLVEKLWAA